MLVLFYSWCSKTVLTQHPELGSTSPSGSVFFLFCFPFSLRNFQHFAQLGEPVFLTVTRPGDFFQKALYCVTKEQI